jgi:MFS family permease
MAVYRRILTQPGVALLLGATLLARMPIGVNGLAVLLYTRAVTGSYATAGVIVGALALGSAVGAPFQGRLVDRRGRGMLLRLAAAHASGLAAIWLLGELGAGAGPLAAAALVSGAALPPVASVLRASWPHILRERPELITGAYALDSVLIEVIFISGPLLTAVIAAVAVPQLALVVSAACVLAGTVGFVARISAPAAPEGTAASTGFLGALGSSGIRTLVLATLPVGFCLGAIEVALPAFSEDMASGELAGLLLALWSIGSAAGGLLYGAIPRRTSLARTHVAFAILLPLVCLPLATASSPLLMGALVILAGIPIAPLIASRNEVVGSVAPPGAATEAFTWPLTALVAGISLGASAAGGIVEGQGWAAALVVAALAAALGPAVLLTRRRSLTERAVPVG